MTLFPTEGYTRIAGVDEVGRGPLAGPVVAAAVLLPEAFDIDGLADSKTLSSARREQLAARLYAGAKIGLAYLPAPMIDRLNIHAATLLAMRRAVMALPAKPDLILVDGKFLPAGLPCRAEALIKGDSKIAAIAAASIVAKVARDHLMQRAGHHFPGFDLAQNAGYPTKKHRDALNFCGLSPLHRRSFGPCTALVSAPD